MRAAVLLWVLSASAQAASGPVEVRRCEAPLWLELSTQDAPSPRSWTLKSCGEGTPDAEPGLDEENDFFEHVADFSLQRQRSTWTVSLTYRTPGTERAVRWSGTGLLADRKARALRPAAPQLSGPRLSLRLWPRDAPEDVVIFASADNVAMIKAVVKATGVQVEGLELLEPETVTMNFASIDRTEVLRLLGTTAWSLRTGPTSFRYGLPRAQGSPQLSPAEFLELVEPRSPRDFPQPAIELHAELAAAARKRGEGVEAIAHLRAALHLLEPWRSGETRLYLELQVELAELLTMDGRNKQASELLREPLGTLPESAAARLQAGPGLLLRLVGLLLAWDQAVPARALLTQSVANLKQLPEALTVVESIQVHSLRAGLVLATEGAEAGLPAQIEALARWRAMPFASWEWGPSVTRQLLANELELVRAFDRAQLAGPAMERLATAQWLHQLGGGHHAALTRLSERLSVSTKADP